MFLDTLQPGSGINVHVDTGFPSDLIPVLYAALEITGFDIEHGQRVLCRFSGNARLVVDLPCPRGLIAHFEDSGAGGNVFPVGFIVAASTADPLSFEAASVSIGHSAPSGVSLTGIVQGGTAVLSRGWFVVSADAYVPFAQAAGEVAPPSNGARLYLDPGSAPGYFTTTPPDDPIAVGRAVPIGPVAGVLCYFGLWEASDRGTQLAASALQEDRVSDATLTNLANIRTIAVKAGRLYKITCLIPVDALAAGGSRVAIASSDGAPATLVLCYTFHPIPNVSIVDLLTATFGDPGNVLVETTGPGYWDIRGSYRASVDATINAQFGQAASDPSTTSAFAGSFLMVEEQD